MDSIKSILKFVLTTIIAFVVMVIFAGFLFYKWWTAGATAMALDSGLATEATPVSYIYGTVGALTVLLMVLIYMGANKLHELSLYTNTLYIWMGIFAWIGLVLAPVIYHFAA